MSNFSNTIWRKARKDHICEECLNSIKKGEHYHHTTGIQDGEFYNRKDCSKCRIIFEKALQLKIIDDIDCETMYCSLKEWVGKELYQELEKLCGY